MVDKVINLMRGRNFTVSEFLLFNYKKVGITDSEFIILMYLVNINSDCFDLKKMSSELNDDSRNVLKLINSLLEKNILSIDVKSNGSEVSEVIDLTGLYQKLSFLIMDNKDESHSTTIYDLFEQEFGRTLSPMEYEIINAFKDNFFSDELILLALKEAKYNGVSNLRYIDKILEDWNKKGIKCKNDVERERQNFNRKKEKKVDLIDYDWLNENE